MSFFLLLVSQCTSSKVKLCLFLQHSRTHYTCIHTWMHTSLFYLSFSLLTKWVAIYLHDSWASDLSSSLHYTGHTALCKAKYLLSRIWFIINFPISEVFPSSIELEVVWKIMKYFTTLRQSIEIKKEIISHDHRKTLLVLRDCLKLTDYGLFVLSRQRISLLSAKFTSKWNGVESYSLSIRYYSIYTTRQ